MFQSTIFSNHTSLCLQCSFVLKLFNNPILSNFVQEQILIITRHLVLLTFLSLKVTFHLFVLFGMAGQFFNEMHELSELVLARMVLLMDQSPSVLILSVG